MSVCQHHYDSSCRKFGWFWKGFRDENSRHELVLDRTWYSFHKTVQITWQRKLKISVFQKYFLWEKKAQNDIVLNFNRWRVFLSEETYDFHPSDVPLRLWKFSARDLSPGGSLFNSKIKSSTSHLENSATLFPYN